MEKFMLGHRYLKAKCVWRVGNGSNISIYNSPWVANSVSSYILSPRRLPVEATVDFLLTDSGRWREDLVHGSFTACEADAILNLPVGGVGTIDRLSWSLTSLGQYTIKSGYWVARKLFGVASLAGTSSLEGRLWWKNLWRLEVPNKVKIFMWRACNNAIPTAYSLHRRHIASSPICFRCGCAVESVLHALWDYRTVKTVWKELDLLNAARSKVFVNFKDLC